MKRLMQMEKRSPFNIVVSSIVPVPPESTSALGLPVSDSTAAMAHEVSQPLSAIQSSAEAALQWLKKDPPNLERAIRAIERVIDSSHYAGEVVRSVRNTAQKSPPVMTRFDINSLIIDTLNLSSVELSRHGIAVETGLAENLEPVRGDRVQLGRLVTNLIANAVEAMSEVENRRRILRISTEAGKRGEVMVAVEDSGIGFDLAKVDLMFDPFFTTKREGMGLGLSISRSIAESHGGRLMATPAFPHGSIFRFSLPKAWR